MEKKSRTKKWIRYLGITIAALFIIDVIAGNLLVTFALRRPKEVREDIMPEAVTTKKVQSIVSENRKTVGEKRREWLKECEKTGVSIVSDDGLVLKGDLIESGSGSHLWVIAIHGYGYTGNRKAMYDYALPYAERGYNILLPDLRAHGESEGKYIGMGWLDRKDILKWMDLVIGMDPLCEIILHGVSMGGSAVMMTAGEDMSENVKAVVEDCGYSSVWDIFSDEAKYMFHIPDFPLIYTASFFSKLRVGYGFKEASAYEQIKKAKVPVLFIHGSKDNFVNTDMSERLFDACPSGKKMYIAEGAGHGESYFIDPEAYNTVVFGFLKEMAGIQ